MCNISAIETKLDAIQVIKSQVHSHHKQSQKHNLFSIEEVGQDASPLSVLL
jgi:hypothetical protein